MLNLVFLIGFIFATGSLPAAAADRVKLALPAKSMGYLPLFIAAHRGFFKDEAIDIEIPMMLPQLAHNALMSGWFASVTPSNSPLASPSAAKASIPKKTRSQS